MNIGAEPTKLNEIADKVWRMVLGTRLTPVAPCSSPNCQQFVLASVKITGAWNGELTLGCSTAVARHAASIMFGKPEDAAIEEDMRDALGELTNMVGGNFKTLLKGDCRLSVPKLVDELPNNRLVPETITHQWFECDGGWVVIHLLKEAAAA